MSISLVPVEPDNRPPIQDDPEAVPFFREPFKWSLFYANFTLHCIGYYRQMTADELLDARNRFHLAITEEVIPENDVRQAYCLLSEVCRRRCHQAMRENPGLISFYTTGGFFRVIAIRTMMEKVCHKGCSLRTDCPPA